MFLDCQRFTGDKPLDCSSGNGQTVKKLKCAPWPDAAKLSWTKPVVMKNWKEGIP
jgi:hypothetical protein